MTKIRILKSTRSTKKYMAIFTYKDGKIKTVHFGQAGAEDYTIHKDKERRERYLSRHTANENWLKYDTPGALSRWLLWEKTSIPVALREYRRRFNLD